MTTDNEKYFQITGKPHSGLSDPDKYGLTYEEVVRLIVEEKWDNFLRNWRAEQRKRRAVIDKNFVCPRCQKKVIHLNEWLASGDRCRSCDNRKKYTAPPLSRSEKRKGGKWKRETCYFCHLRSTTVKKIGKHTICSTCLKKLKRLKDEVQRQRDTE